MRKPRYAKQLTDLPKPYHTAAMAEVAQQTDRGAAIVGAAYLDLVLRHAITARLCDLPDVMPLLFEDRGPLQNFSARIQVAFALGIYGHRAYADLGIIRHIRNAFAHSAEAMDFNNSYLAERCKELWFPKVRYGKRPMPSTARESFIRAIELLSDGLHENVGRQKDGMPPSAFLMSGPRPPGKSTRKVKPPLTG